MIRRIELSILPSQIAKQRPKSEKEIRLQNPFWNLLLSCRIIHFAIKMLYRFFTILQLLLRKTLMWLNSV
jgi:hypothetical protein